MRFKGTTILFLLFVVLGGYVYFTEFRGKEERQKKEETKNIKMLSIIMNTLILHHTTTKETNGLLWMCQGSE